MEISLPNEQGRLEVLKIHAAPITKHGEIDYEVCTFNYPLFLITYPYIVH